MVWTSLSFRDKTQVLFPGEWPLLRGLGAISPVRITEELEATYLGILPKMHPVETNKKKKTP